MATNISSIQTDHIALRNVNKSYGEGDLSNQVLFDISIDIQAGHLNLLVGPSGCGKTTLISIIAGILSADSGEMTLFDIPLHFLSDAEKTHFRKYNVGFVFQQFNLISTLSVRENVAIPLMIQGAKRQDALEKATEMLHEVHLENRMDLSPSLLSVGQQQRVAVARALISNPRLLICDEPTAALDAQNGKLVMGMIRDLAIHPERVVIVVTHDQRVLDFGDQIIDMEDGRITRIVKRSDFKDAL